MSLANLTKLKRKAAELEQKKQFEKALALYIQIIDEAGRDLDDADLQLFNRVGDLLLRAGNTSESLAYYEKAVDMYAERGFLNNAIALCNKILRQSPGRTAVYYKLGKISASKGFKSDAKKNFLEYADRMQKAGKIEESFRALKEFADLCPDQDDIRLMLADLLARENRSGEALEQLERLYHKLDGEGRDAEARATLDRIKAIDPTATPRPSGTFEVVRNNDLIFLDVGEVAARRRTPTLTPVAPMRAQTPPRSVSATPGKRIGALEGLELTFVPEEEPPSDDLAGDAVAPLEDMVELISLPKHEDQRLELLDTGYSSDSNLAIGATTWSDSAADEVLDGEESTGVDQTSATEETPDEWVTSALSATLDDFSFDRLLTSLSSPAIEDREESVEPAEVHAEVSQREDSEAEPSVAWAVAELSGEIDPDRDDEEARGPVAAAPELDDAAVAAAREEAELVEISLNAAVAEAAAVVASDGQDGEGTFELDDLIVRSAGTGALALDGLRSDDGATETTDDAAILPAPLVQSAFQERPVELPMLDVGAISPETTVGQGELDDLLSSTPSFTEPLADPDFVPSALMESGSTDEWPAGAAPEVLIDGDWRDEHVGEFVSGEVHAVPPHSLKATAAPAVFDDLTAAMMSAADAAEHDRLGGGGPTPASPETFMVRGTPRGTLSFGGVEAHLRRRVELEPTNWGLKRLLGEALIDRAEREQGLNVLDEAMRGFESANDLRSAREVVDVILMVVPLSVRHHQKRVEYAVRANDKVQLVEAYAELADALFRCGEASKSRVVYARVLELAPAFERARVALQLLPSEKESVLASTRARPRSRLQSPSTELATLSPGDDAMPTLEEALALPLLDGVLTGGATRPNRDLIDLEIDKAFDTTREPDPEADSLPPVPPVDSRYVNIGAWLSDDPPARSTRMIADDVAPSGDEDADFAEMLRRFKHELARNVEDEDYASHYDLGIAFRGMGLIDEAISEFQKALRGSVGRVRAYEALGECFVDKGQHDVAAALLERATETAGVDDQALIGVLYLLGSSCETLERESDALRYFQRVFAVDVNFKDVQARLAALQHATLDATAQNKRKSHPRSRPGSTR
ncbi:MAG: hypothetical protein ACT4OZ_00465 [Gemmatimonadota bacterium]